VERLPQLKVPRFKILGIEQFSVFCVGGPAAQPVYDAVLHDCAHAGRDPIDATATVTNITPNSHLKILDPMRLQ
jgi:hypothetical protein